MSKIVIGTRGSKLALYQAEQVARALSAVLPEGKEGIEVKIIRTRGDKFLELSLTNQPDKGLFTREIEQQLREGTIDMAVHSLKDLPVDDAPGLAVGAYLPRAETADVVIGRQPLSALPPHSVVGTSSRRRAFQLRLQYPDLQFRDIRGNVETRIAKTDAGEYDAIVMAKAGIVRLGLEERIVETLPESVVVPAPGQAAIAVQVRNDDEKMSRLMQQIDHSATRLEVETERRLLKSLGGGCALPFGCVCKLQGERICLKAFFADDQGLRHCFTDTSFAVDDRRQAIKALTERLLHFDSVVERTSSAYESASPTSEESSSVCEPPLSSASESAVSPAATSLLSSGNATSARSPRVFLVGAGPGNPDLLTLRAKSLLEKAEVIIYDALVDPSVLRHASPHAKKIYAGKRAGKHSYTQTEINDLILQAARETAGIVVRLKGGDPFVFGRGGEEMEVLRQAGIAYEVVPGITSGIAAPAAFGIPVTQRGMSRSVSLVTAATREGGLPDLDWHSMVALGGTWVFYMGMRAVPDIARCLLEAGLPPRCPAAIVSQGTTPRQRILTADISQFTPDFADYESLSPGLFVVGDVVSFAKNHHQEPPLPLAGRSVVVTRSLDVSSDLCRLLEEQGADVTLLPTIEIVPFEEQTALRAAIDHISAYSWLLFSSTHAVDVFFRELDAAGKDSRHLAPCRIAAVGPATERSLKARGIRTDFVPLKHTGKSMAEEMVQRFPSMVGTKVLLPTSKIARPEVLTALQEHGIGCEQLAVYDNIPLSHDADRLRELLVPGGWITFCSSSAVDHLMLLLEQHGLRTLLKAMKTAAIGEVTAATLRRHGITPATVAATATMPSLVESIIKHSS